MKVMLVKYSENGLTLGSSSVRSKDKVYFRKKYKPMITSNDT